MRRDVSGREWARGRRGRRVHVRLGNAERVSARRTRRLSETTHETGKRVEAAEVVEGLEVGLECGCDGDGVCGEGECGAGLEEERRRRERRRKK